MKNAPVITLCLLLLLSLSCTEDITDQPRANQPPRTFLWLVPDSTVGVGVSRQRLHWWGEDPDGVVGGFLFAFTVFPNQVASLPNPDTLRYTWVTANDTLILFPLDTLFRNFTVFVRAVDDNFAGIPNQSQVRMGPSPFWDKNGNSVFDSTDEALPEIAGAIDPVGAIQTFPVRNTPPRLEFAFNPNNPTAVVKQPDTTFTAATFGWKGFDDDGDNTLSQYQIALNDTTDPSRWLTIPLRDTVVTLVVPRARSDLAGAEVEADIYGGRFLGRQFLGRISGLRLDALNVLYARVRDVAGEFSQTIRMPSGTDHWYVKRPRGRLLMVSDMLSDPLNIERSVAADTTYRITLAQVPDTQFLYVDKLDIALGLNSNNKGSYWLGRLVPAYLDPALIYTFLLYDYVFWYTDPLPTLFVAQVSLFPYLQNGGKVLLSTMFQVTADPSNALRDFAPIDSVGTAGGDNRIFGSYMLFADSANPQTPYPNLQVNGPITAVYSQGFFMRPIYRRSDARYIYHLQTSHTNPPRYPGTPNVGVVDGQGTIVFVALPLYLLNERSAGSGLTAFFTRTLTQSFRPTQRVDRTKF